MSDFKFINPNIAFEPTITSSGLVKPKPFLPYVFLFSLIVLVSGGITFMCAFFAAHTIPSSCIESVYSLKAGQSLTCNDPRAKLNLVSVRTDATTFMCACKESSK